MSKIHNVERKYSGMVVLYLRAQNAKVGESISCPHCNKKHIKSTYQKVFCSNHTTKGRNNCKDNFWNKVDPDKRSRNTPYFNEVILPGIALANGFPDVETMRNHVDDFDGSWDAHGAPTVSNCEWCGLRAEYCTCE